MKKIFTAFYIYSLLLLCSSSLLAQVSVIKGKVTDAGTSDPVPFINVGIKGQSVGTFTDSNGNYKLELPYGAYTVVFSSIGYEKLEKNFILDGNHPVSFNVVLKPVSHELNTVVVSASKYEQKIQESISSIEVLKPDLIRNTNSQSVDKAVEQMPGITIVDNEPQIRGGSGFSSGLGSRVMILVDDMPLLQGDAGRPNWNFMPIDDIDQIEILKGASSVIYGSSAINGAINVRTAWPKDGPETRVNTFLGMYNKPTPRYATPWTGMNPLTYGISIAHSQKFSNYDLCGGISYYNDQGYIRGVPEKAYTDSSFNNGEFNKRFKFYFNTRVRNKKVEGLTYGLNGNLMYSQNASTYFWYDSDTNIYRSYPGALSIFKELDFYADPFLKYFPKNGDSYTFRNRVYFANSNGNNNQSSESVTIFDEFQFTHKFKKLGDIVLVTGIMNSWVYSYGKVFSGDLAADGRPTTGNNGTANSENLAVYLQLEKKFFKRLNILIGGRYEYYQVTGLTDSKPVFRTGLNFQAARGTFLRASVGQGFRFPSIGERDITTNSGSFGFYPNPKLAAETSVSYEVGAKQLFKIGKFLGMADVAGFYQDYENYVEFNFGFFGNNADAKKNLGFKFFNTGPARIYGVDCSVAGEGPVARNLNLSILVGYTYSIPQSLNTHYIFTTVNGQHYNYLNTSSDTNGHVLKYRVQSLLKSDVQIGWKKVFAGFSGKYYGYMKNIDRSFYDFLDGNFGVHTGIVKYREDHNTGTFILDFRVGITIQEFMLSFLVNNLFNTEFSLRPMTMEAPRTTSLQVVYKI